MFCCSLVKAQNHDTIFEGFKYNLIVRFSNGSISQFTNIKRSIGKYISNGPCVYFYSNNKMSKHGDLKDGMMTGFWTFYYSNGQKEKEGNYVIGKELIFIARPPDKDKSVPASIESGVWKYWDEDGKEIPLTVYNSIYTKTNLQKSIDYFLQIRNNKTLIEEQNTTLNYYKKYFKKKYPSEIFWKDSLIADNLKAPVEKANLKKEEKDNTVKNTFVIEGEITYICDITKH